jgi:hypothetical protein
VPAPAPAPAENPWRTLGIGTAFEARIVTHVETPSALETETIQRQTLTARDARFATVRVEVVTNGIASPARESLVPLDSLDGEEPAPAASEDVTVPAGTFACRKSVVETREGGATTTTETWTAPGLPLPVKRVVRGAGATATLELVKVAKK